MTLIMVVDDDQDLAEMLAIVLTGEGMEVDLVGRGDEVMEIFRATPPDLVLLDIMLPGIDGIEVCRQIRAESMIPIVMLTAKGETAEIIKGLEFGADDYIVKPFKPKELVARIKARLRKEDVKAELLTLADLTIDVVGHSVKRNGKEISLTPLEFDLLLALARKPLSIKEAMVSPTINSS